MSHLISRPTSWARTLALTVLLVFLQLGALTHTLEHLKETKDTQSPSPSPELVCEWCAAYAHHAAPTVATPLACVPPDAPPAPCLRALPLRPARFTAYLSQAPPRFS